MRARKLRFRVRVHSVFELLLSRGRSQQLSHDFVWNSMPIVWKGNTCMECCIVDYLRKRATGSLWGERPHPENLQLIQICLQVRVIDHVGTACAMPAFDRLLPAESRIVNKSRYRNT